MLESTKILLRLSELRESINKATEATDASELEAWRNESLKLEAEYRAALNDESREAVPVQDGQPAEVRSLLRDASLTAYVQAAINQRPVEGREAELSAAMGLPAHSFPLELLTESRAIATITGDTEGNQRPVIGQLFPNASSTFLGITAETVPVGEALYPVLSTGATVHSPAKDAAAAESTAAFTVKTLKPGRLQAGFSYAVENAAVFAGLDASLQANLREALGNELDAKIVSLLNSTAVAADPDAPSAQTDATGYLSAMYEAVDGVRAQTLRDCRILVGVGTGGVYAHMASRYESSVRDNALNILNRESGGVRASAHIPAYANNHQDAILRKGAARDAVAALWQGVRVIVDPYTKAGEGEIVLTANMLYAADVVRAAGFERHAFRTS